MFDVKLCLPFNFMMKWYCYNLLLPSSSMNVACMLHFYANRNFVIYPSPHDSPILLNCFVFHFLKITIAKKVRMVEAVVSLKFIIKSGAFTIDLW